MAAVKGSTTLPDKAFPASPALAQLLALGFFTEHGHRPRRLQQVNPRRIPLPRPSGVEALLPIPLERVPGDGHREMMKGE